MITKNVTFKELETLLSIASFGVYNIFDDRDEYEILADIIFVK